MHAYIDASHDSHTDTISHSGMVLALRNSLVMFKNKKQIFIRSWTVAELVALTDMTQYALHLSEFLAEEGLPLVPLVLMQDNQSVLKIVASNGKTLPNKLMRIFLN